MSKCVVLHIKNMNNPEKRKIEKAVEILEKGGIIVYPTDTVYGMGCSIFNKKGIQKIYKIKQMESKKLLSFICSDLKHISDFAEVQDYAYKAMKRNIPGAYTFVLKASRTLPKLLRSNRKTAGIRVPDNNVCLDLVKKLGEPIITTSITSNSDEIYTDPYYIEENFRNDIDCILDCGKIVNNLSTIVDLSGSFPEVLRKGLGDIKPFI